MVQFYCFLDRTDGVAQTSVTLDTLLGDDRGVLRRDKTLVHQLRHILFHRFDRELHRLTDCLIGRPALMGLAVFDIEQVSVDA